MAGQKEVVEEVFHRVEGRAMRVQEWGERAAREGGVVDEKIQVNRG